MTARIRYGPLGPIHLGKPRRPPFPPSLGLSPQTESIGKTILEWEPDDADKLSHLEAVMKSLREATMAAFDLAESRPTDRRVRRAVLLARKMRFAQLELEARKGAKALREGSVSR